MEELKPETPYFTVVDGARGGHFIVNIDGASDPPGFVPSAIDRGYVVLKGLEQTGVRGRR
jgi:hypothetical protein